MWWFLWSEPSHCIEALSFALQLDGEDALVTCVVFYPKADTDIHLIAIWLDL